MFGPQVGELYVLDPEHLLACSSAGVALHRMKDGCKTKSQRQHYSKGERKIASALQRAAAVEV